MNRLLKIQFVFFLLYSLGANAQMKTVKSSNQKEPAKKTDKIYTRAQHMPEFPGEKTAVIEYLKANTKYPEEAKAKGIKGSVLVRFVVDSTGKVGNAKVTKGLGAGCDEEALRVINSMPLWKPGIDSGRAVNTYFNLPVRFSPEPPVDSNFYGRGMDMMKKANYTEARDLFTKAIDENPQNAKALYYRGAVFLKLKEIDKACNDWGRASEIGDDGAKNMVRKHCQR